MDLASAWSQCLEVVCEMVWQEVGAVLFTHIDYVVHWLHLQRYKDVFIAESVDG